MADLTTGNQACREFLLLKRSMPRDHNVKSTPFLTHVSIGIIRVHLLIICLISSAPPVPRHKLNLLTDIRWHCSVRNEIIERQVGTRAQALAQICRGVSVPSCVRISRLILRLDAFARNNADLKTR